jgi:hypothetical protein
MISPNAVMYILSGCILGGGLVVGVWLLVLSRIALQIDEKRSAFYRRLGILMIVLSPLLFIIGIMAMRS